MSEVPQGLLQILWAGLAAGAAAGCAIAAVLVFRASRNASAETTSNNALSEQWKKRHRLLLLCGDAKVLTDLAIQRHMADATFLRRLRAQPFYSELLPYFNEGLRQEMEQEAVDQSDGFILASACRNEIERLEREWRVTSL